MDRWEWYFGPDSVIIGGQLDMLFNEPKPPGIVIVRDKIDEF
jgi:hypothetical protein